MDRQTSSVEVLIIGGGPVGMIMASELSRYGVECRVVDKRPGPIDVTHACVLWTRTQEVLAAMGIREKWVPHALLLREMNVYGFGKRLGAIEYEGLDSPYPHPLLVGQNTTERLLIEHLSEQGVTVERPVDAVRMQHTPDATVVALPEKGTTTLFEIMHGTNWNLLLLSGNEPGAETLQQLAEIAGAVIAKYTHVMTPHIVIGLPVPPNNLQWSGSTLMDSELILHQKYGEKGASLYLIRPDGYIGFRGTLAQREQLLKYLGSILKEATAIPVMKELEILQNNV